MSLGRFNHGKRGNFGNGGLGLHSPDIGAWSAGIPGIEKIAP